MLWTDTHFPEQEKETQMEIKISPEYCNFNKLNACPEPDKH